jgi:regulator of protease activity HflC (stomatin/prohibitin superfamily)
MASPDWSDMVGEYPGAEAAPTEGTQLSQVRVPMSEAAEAFAIRDPSGATPIVVVLTNPGRIDPRLTGAAGLSVVVALVAGLLFDRATFMALGLGVAVVLALLAVWRSFLVRVPEGTTGLLSRRGRYAGEIGPGSQMIPPWIALSHLVTRREIPFDAPPIEAPTGDNVRATIDALMTFSIVDPYRFIYSISATDFDAVLHASCRSEIRRMVRSNTWDQINDLARADMEDLRAAMSADVERYGVNVSKVTVTSALPPVEFLASEEARRLAILQRAEEDEKQVLAQRRQAASDAIARQQILAQVDREHEALQIRIQEAETKHRLAELEADAVRVRLERLEEALAQFPHAAEYDFQSIQLQVVSSLAGNTRAVVQIGADNDIARAFVIRDVLRYGDQSQPAPQLDGEEIVSPQPNAGGG